MNNIKKYNFVSTNDAHVKDSITLLKQIGDICYSNYFGMPDDTPIEWYKTDHTLLIRKKEDAYYRLYIVSTEETELCELLTNCNDEEYVVNVPTKGTIEQWDVILKKAGFKFYAEYHRYFNKKFCYRESATGEYAILNDTTQILGLFDGLFSQYTDYLPTEAELKDWITNHQVLVNRDEDGNVCGALLFKIEGKKCYLRIWVDKGKMGLFLLFKGYNIAVENGVSLVYFWVNSANKNVIRLHTLFGAQADGLKDYTYIKNII